MTSGRSPLEPVRTMNLDARSVPTYAQKANSMQIWCDDYSPLPDAITVIDIQLLPR